MIVLSAVAKILLKGESATIIFSGNRGVSSMADLVFTRVRAILNVKYGLNSTVVLLNHTFADVQEANFSFDPSGQATVGAWAGDFVI